MMKAFNIDGMKFAAFNTLEDACRHRSIYGGWIFKSADESEFVWFDSSYTVTPIMTHKAIRGMSGVLV